MIIKWSLIAAASVFGGSGASGTTNPPSPLQGLPNWQAGCSASRSATGTYVLDCDEAAIIGSPGGATGAALPLVTFAGSTFDGNFTAIGVPNATPVPLPNGTTLFPGQRWTFNLFKAGVLADPIGSAQFALFTVGELGTNI